MTKDILITLLNALQIELGLLLLFFLVLVLGLRSRLSKSTQSRILIGLISTIVITFLAFVVLAYRNDMIDTSKWSHLQPSSVDLESRSSQNDFSIPRWLLAIVFFALAVWRVSWLLKCRNNHRLFTANILYRSIDKSKMHSAIHFHSAREGWFFGSISLFAAISYIKALNPYLYIIAFAVIASHLFLSITGEVMFRQKKNVSN